MRRIGPDDYVSLSAEEKRTLDAWIDAEGLGPVGNIKEIREFPGGLEVDRYLRDPDGHRYRDGDHIAMETLTHIPKEVLPV